ncbi:MAG: NAD(P)/FAD-dependent oxidoreductase [Panacagrimonas sp.]
MDKIDCVVVGAGAVGLAIARELARNGRSILICEAEDGFGTVTSARNSEVIHAGIYYPQGSLKAELCVRGRGLLYEFCRSRGVPHRRSGKWIVATHDSQLGQLEGIGQAAARNGVTDLHPITREQALADEPQLHCVAALVSPSTGILDSHAYMLALLGEAEDHGATLVLRTRVRAVRRGPEGLELTFGDESEPSLATEWIVNSAGLDAPALAAAIEGFPTKSVPKASFAKGSYFSLQGKSPFTRLIYPIPEPGGLGVHLTLDMAGQARFGPDVEWVDQPDYTVNPRRCERFYPVIRTYWPGLKDGTLVPAYAGVRPKISGPGEPAADFVIEGPAQHGFEGVVNLFGIESPGLTSSLALAERVGAIINSG